ncbi:MAG: hypothetical protein GX144_00830 [Clostridiaceae bacterium]|nr:hypothetical protein [Clostridiaceae bacterium]
MNKPNLKKMKLDDKHRVNALIQDEAVNTVKSCWKSRYLWLKSAGLALPCAVYAAAAMFFPEMENLLHKVVVIVLLVIGSYQDIRENKFSMLLPSFIFLVNGFHGILYTHDIVVWVIGAALFLVLLPVWLVKKKMIGFGDNLLLALCITALSVEEILMFLFLSFFLSAIFGVVCGFGKRKVRGTSVPMIPCITLAFISGCLIF